MISFTISRWKGTSRGLQYLVESVAQTWIYTVILFQTSDRGYSVNNSEEYRALTVCERSDLLL